MLRTSPEQRRFYEHLDREALREHQLERLNALLVAIMPHNRFYAEKLRHVELPLQSLDELANLPFTYKDELLTTGCPADFAANCSFPLERYVRYHQTSGTRGRPLAVLDTAEDWQWWIDCWQFVLDAAEIGPEDRIALAFSFGTLIGFWRAHDAAVARGAMVIPSGGMSTLARVEMIRNCRATALFCTPSYALRLADVALENRIDPASLEVRRIVVAGEPGGSVPALRKRIETAWNAKLIDHAGASEVGPWGHSDPARRGLHVLETEFIAEFLSLTTGGPAEEGEISELVLTPLGRLGSPVVRYRTGDLVKPVYGHGGANHFVLLDGGVLGRADDMMIVRGVNIFPSSLEQILRSFPEVVEFRTTCRKNGAMDVLTIEIEDRLEKPDRVALEMNLRLGLKVDVRCVPLGSLPRTEGKGRRFVDLRKAPAETR